MASCSDEIKDSIEKLFKDFKHVGKLKATTLVKKLLEDICTKVELPSQKKADEKGKLEIEYWSQEFRLRHQDLKDFAHELGKECKYDQICNKFKNFLKSRSRLEDCRLKDAYKSAFNRSEKYFVHKGRIVGVVLRTSPSYVSLLSLDGLNELLLEVDRRFVGLGIEVRTGDVIDVVNTELKSKRHDLDPELVCCYSLEPTEVNTYLEKLKEQDDPCTILEDFLRSEAIWKYILNIPENELLQQRETGRAILQVCQKVSSISFPSPMAIGNFWTSFEGSRFFNDVLLNLVRNEAWQEENVNLVTNFLENLISHLPRCGIIALVIVENLKLQNNGMEFMKKLLSILALNVTGVQDNLEYLKWNQQPIIPVSSELCTTETHSKDLPCIKLATDNKTAEKKTAEKKTAEKNPAEYESEEEYLMTYYTLLREECFHKLKKGISNFLQTGEFDPKDIMMYRVHLAKVDPNTKQSIQEGLSLVLEIKCNKSNENDAPEDPNAIDDPDNSKWLMYGNLLCLSFDATFKCPVWGIIIGKPEDDTDRTRQVHVGLCSDRNKFTDAEVITKLQNLQNQGFLAYLVESNTFYTAYGPPMEVLQQKETVPFKEQLVKVQKCTNDPPEYLKNIKKHPDWTVIFGNPSCIELHKEDEYNYEILIKEFKKLRENPESESKLDEGQLDALQQALQNKVTLIQGPPGTGKSFVGEALLQLLLSLMEVPDDIGPILVVTYKNHALDNFLEDCLKKNPNVQDQLVRVGRVGDDTSDKLKERNLNELRKNSPINSNYKTSQKIKFQLEAMKPEINKCVQGLQHHNKFTVSVFIKEADDQHFKHLSKDCDYVEKINELVKDKHFREKHFKELLKIIEEPLKKWLPNQKEFDNFAGKVGEKGLSSFVQDMDVAVKQQSTREPDKGKKEEKDHSRHSLPSDDLKERVADLDDDQDNKDDCADASLTPDSPDLSQEDALVILPEIPDEKLKNVKTILNAGNIQDLKDHEKIQMVYALQKQRYKSVTKEFLKKTREFTQKQQRRKELRDLSDIEILKRCQVIGMTVSGAAIRTSLLGSIKPSVIIVEEAAEILESQLVAVIPSSVQHLIMIGDHKQLRPQVHYNLLSRKCNFSFSMFERLIIGGLEYAQLNKQGRMRDEIAQLVRELGIYEVYETRREVERKHEGLGCLSKYMFFYDHTIPEKHQQGSHSMYNEHEADQITKLAKCLVCDNNVDVGRISILCSYRGQQ